MKNVIYSKLKINSISKKKIWSLTWPIILANLSIPLVGLTDASIMGHMPNTLYIAGVALSGIIFNFLFSIFSFLRMGTTGLISQAYGQQNYNEIWLCLYRVIIISLLIGGVILTFQNQLLAFAIYILAPDVKLEPIINQYFKIRILAIPAGLINMVILGWFFGIQKPKLIMLQLLIINFCNIILSLYFVLFLKWGVSGVAYGSVYSQYLGLIISILFIYKYKINRYSQKLDLKNIFLIPQLKKFGSISKELLIRTLCLIFIQSYLLYMASSIGIIELATIEILLIIFNFTSYGLDGFAHTAEALTGQAIGAKKKYLLQQSTKKTTEMAIIMAILISMIWFISKDIIINLITNIPELKKMVWELWPLLVATPLISVFAFQLDGIFIGATLVKEMRNSVILAMIIFLISIEIFSINGINLNELWLSFLIYLSIRGLVLMCYYSKVLKIIT